MLKDGFVPLRNAQQSSNLTLYGCRGNKCTADRAIDNDQSTSAITRRSSLAWWTAELTRAAKISMIIFSTSEFAFGEGNFKNFKVETRLSPLGPWKICKGEHAMQRPVFNHVVQCENPMSARYIRLSVRSENPSTKGQGLTLNEVRVKEIPQGEKVLSMENFLSMETFALKLTAIFIS